MCGAQTFGMGFMQFGLTLGSAWAGQLGMESPSTFGMITGYLMAVSLSIALEFQFHDAFCQTRLLNTIASSQVGDGDE